MTNIIISRKGFDSGAGGCASPILPDGRTAVPLPIPDDTSSKWDYDGLIEQTTGLSYRQLIKELRPRCAKDLKQCHLDPDINPNLHPEDGWVPIFGQDGGAEGILEKYGVEVGDIFLYFGWYKGTVEHDGSIRYANKKDGLDFYHCSDIHMLFGHLKVKEVVRDPDEMRERFSWHPHAERHKKFRNNTMYVGDRGSSGVLPFDEKRVLTRKGCTRSKWDADMLGWMRGDMDRMSMQPVFSGETVHFRGRWQELVIQDASDECLDWVEEMI